MTILGLQMVIFSLCPHMDFPGCVPTCTYNYISSVELESTLVNLYNINDFFKYYLQKLSYLEVSRVRASTYELGEGHNALLSLHL